MTLDVSIVVGNPKPRSRTYHAALAVAERVTGTKPGSVIDLVEFGPEILDPKSTVVTAAVEDVRKSDVIIFATPTYKGSYTGLLKIFLDCFPANSLSGSVAVPVMLGGSAAHSLAVEVFLKPIIAHFGCTCPPHGLYLLETTYDDLEHYSGELEVIRKFVAANTTR